AGSHARAYRNAPRLWRKMPRLWMHAAPPPGCCAAIGACCTCHVGGVDQGRRLHRSTRTAVCYPKPRLAAPSVFRHGRAGSLTGVVIISPLRQDFSDAQTLVRQGFDRKLSAC
ncbi:hypothetical protein, partial [Xanthomonas phaseoli]